MSNNPPKYLKDLPRVSQIVESVFPFEGEAQRRFIDWLSNLKIDLEDYMEEASTWGTYVHKSLEDYLDGKLFKWKKYKPLVESWIKFIEEYKVKKLATEHYVRTKYYQWTIDLVAEMDGEEWILDWKTYGLAKIKWWLQSTYRKPYDKLKKARLQLSLYALAMGIKNIAVVELTEGWYYFHKLEVMDTIELLEICTRYYYSYIDQI